MLPAASTTTTTTTNLHFNCVSLLCFFVVVAGISPCCLMHSQCAEFAANLWQFNENYLFRYTTAPPLQPPSTRRWRRRRNRRCCQAFSCLLIIKWVSLHIPSKVKLQRVGHSNRGICICMQI